MSFGTICHGPKSFDEQEQNAPGGLEGSRPERVSGGNVTFFIALPPSRMSFGTISHSRVRRRGGRSVAAARKLRPPGAERPEPSRGGFGTKCNVFHRLLPAR